MDFVARQGIVWGMVEKNEDVRYVGCYRKEWSLKAQGNLVFMEGEDLGSGGWLGMESFSLGAFGVSVFGAVIAAPGLS